MASWASLALQGDCKFFDEYIREELHSLSCVNIILEKFSLKVDPSIFQGEKIKNKKNRLQEVY